MDEIDKVKFPFSAPEGWLSMAGWSGRDIYDQEPIYTLELVIGDGQEKTAEPEKRAILWRFEDVRNLDSLRNPKPLTEDNVADAAGHLGFKYFRSEPFRRGALWIIEEPEDETCAATRPVSAATDFLTNRD